MAVERIQQAFPQDSEGRFYILYGKGIDDAFVSEAGEEWNIETALLDYLNENHFERVVFTAPHRPLYFLDDRSEDLTQPPSMLDQQDAEEQDPDEMQYLNEGPFGSLLLIRPPRRQRTRGYGNAIGDDFALGLMNRVFQDTQTCRSAIVVVQAEAWLEHFRDTRSLAGYLGEWARLPAVNKNACFFLFSVDDYPALRLLSERLPIPELRSLINRESGLKRSGYAVEIPTPEMNEVSRLIQYGAEELELPSRPEDQPLLAEFMAAEGLRARQWLSRFEETARIDLETARSAGWFRATRGEHKSIQERLDEMVGLDAIKERIQELSSWCLYQSRRKAASKRPVDPPMLHLLFTGNPGTGKTTVARLIGEIFHDLRLLNRGHLVEVKAAELIAEHVGGTALKTNQVVDQALDGVLFIDEAYSLTENERGGFGMEAVDTLLKRMEDDRERLVVIVAGYPEKMDHFLRSNPGLSRRFPKENQFDFPDYSAEDLDTILLRMLETREIPLEEKTGEVLRNLVEALFADRDAAFGNAGEMRNLAEGLDRKRAARIVKQNLPYTSPLALDDIPDRYKPYLKIETWDIDAVMLDLEKLVGLRSVKTVVEMISNRLRLDMLRRQQNPAIQVDIPMQHLIFVGSPGTGKTTVARLIGRIYNALGLLRKGHCVEVSRADLVAGYVGQTAIKTREKIHEALDGVLFIDEAYSLECGGPVDYGHEAVETLMLAMENYRQRLLVIVAGYPQEMEHFIRSNPGLRSRFGTTIEFPDFSPDELLAILTERVHQEGYTIPDPVLRKVQKYLAAVKGKQGASFGNARSVNTLFDQMKSSFAERKIREVQAQHSLQEPADLDLSTFDLVDVPVLPKNAAPQPQPRLPIFPPTKGEAPGLNANLPTAQFAEQAKPAEHRKTSPRAAAKKKALPKDGGSG